MIRNVFLSCLLLIASASIAQKKSKKDYLITINTSFGPMQLVLHDQTPLHKANFLSLVQRNFYDSLLFHRVIEQFMIQGGDPDSKTTQAGTMLWWRRRSTEPNTCRVCTRAFS